jgi:hypothetical protein
MMQSPSKLSMERMIQMAKKEGHEKGVGPYSKDDNSEYTNPRRTKPSAPRDVYKNAFENGDRTDGFAAKLTPKD